MSSTQLADAEREFKERKKPESLRLQDTSPVITANDLAASVAWYRDVLGFIVADERRDEDGTLMGATVRAGTVDIHLSQDDFAKGRDRPKGEGFRFYCRTTQDPDELAEGIKSRGGSLDMEPTDAPFGARIFAVTDPDGFKISIGREA